MRPDIHTLTGAYAVDALPTDEREVFEEHLEVCDACRQEVAEFQATAAHLGATLAEPPPAGLRDAVMAEIDQTRQEPPQAQATDLDEQRARRRPDGRRWWTMLAAPAAAVAAIVVVGLSFMVADLNDRIDRVESAADQVVDVLAAEDADTHTVEGPGGEMARVVAAPSRGEAVFLARGMPALPDEETYQLWLIDHEEDPTSAGLFEMDQRERSMRVLTGDLAGAAAVAVTVEPAGGSTEPTSDPIMVMELEEA